MENASRNYSYSDIKSKIKRQTEKYGWEFIFLAANIDAAATAEDIGIRPDRAANYKQSREGYEDCFAAMSMFCTLKRTSASKKEIDKAWKQNLEENEVN
jgi:hypothetical protein